MPSESKKLDTLIHKVDAVISKQTDLEKTEQVILNTVTVEEEDIQKEIGQIKSITGFQRLLLQKATKHKILFPIIIVVGVVLVWRGLWGIFDQTPIISYYIVSLLVGILLLWFFNRLKSL